MGNNVCVCARQRKLVQRESEWKNANNCSRRRRRQAKEECLDLSGRRVSPTPRRMRRKKRRGEERKSERLFACEYVPSQSDRANRHARNLLIRARARVPRNGNGLVRLSLPTVLSFVFLGLLSFLVTHAHTHTRTAVQTFVCVRDRCDVVMSCVCVCVCPPSASSSSNGCDWLCHTS